MSSVSNINRFALDAFFQEAIHGFAHPHNIDLTSEQVFKLLFDVDDLERVDGFRFDDHVDVALFCRLVSGERTKNAKRHDSVFRAGFELELPESG